MTAFSGQDLHGAQFSDVDLAGATFRHVRFTGARLADVDLSRVKIRDALIADLRIDGELVALRVNGVDVAPLVEAELDRRHPDRARMRPTDAEGFRVAWAALERLWEETAERARGLDPALLHERVDGEWSFVETLRHLLFVTDAWARRALEGDPAPWHPLDLPHDEMPDVPGVPRDRSAQPSLEEVLALRADRVAGVRAVLADLTDQQLAGLTVPVTEPGYPESESFPVLRCLRAVVDEEWQHRLYAERDLDLLVGSEASAAAGATA